MVNKFLLGVVMNNIKKRNSNLELLRIVSMFCILLHHFAYHGSSSWASHYNYLYLSSEKVYLFLACLGKAAVVSFVMIGAFFLAQKKFKLWRIINLCLTTLIYSWLIYIFILWKFPQAVKTVTPMNLWLPIPIPSNYWFVVAYVYMLMLMPFMNLILEKTTRKQILLIIGLFTILWTVLPFIPNTKADNSGYNFYFYYNYFLLIYLISGYIRIYQPNWANSLIKSSVFFVAVVAIIIVIILNVSSKNYASLAGTFATLNNIFSLALGISIFVLFKNINVGHNVVINYIAKSMFGVYLIHDNSFVRPLLWQKLVHTNRYATDYVGYIKYGLVITLFVFFSCIIIDVIKRIIIDPPVNKTLMKLNTKFLAWSSR